MPKFVRRASLLLVAAAVLAVLAAVLAIVAKHHLDAAEPAYAQGLVHYREKPTSVPQQIRFGLGYNLIAALAAAVVAGLLAGLIRRPHRWVRIAGFTLPGLAWIALGFGLAAGPDIADAPDAWMYTQAMKHLQQNLLPSWYPAFDTLVTLGVLAAMTVVAVLMFRHEAGEFYLHTKQADDDPRWAAILEKRRQANAAAGEPLQ